LEVGILENVRQRKLAFATCSTTPQIALTTPSGRYAPLPRTACSLAMSFFTSVAGYARAFRRGERVGTAHLESTVNQLINWRFCKKQQMAWTKAGAQALLQSA